MQKFRGTSLQETTQKMNDLLEESQNSWKVIILIVVVYYKERIQSKIEQRKNGIGQSPGKEPNMELLLPSFCGVHMLLLWH